MSAGTEGIAFADDEVETAKVEPEAVDATEDDFLSKKQRQMKFKVRFTEDGPAKIVTIVALDRIELDELQVKHPATPKQARSGAALNPETYPPALLAACVTVPKMSVEKWTEVWTSKNWSHGEHMSLHRTVEQFCTEQLDLSPFDND